MRDLITVFVEHAPGETRAAAFLTDGKPFSLFCWRDPKVDSTPRLGEIHSGIVRRIDAAQRGVFVELDCGETGFFNYSDKVAAPSEGARMTFRIRAEAWAEKSALLQPVKSAEKRYSRDDAFREWISGLSVEGFDVDVDDSEGSAQHIDAAYDEASSETLTLMNGGSIHFEQTRALLAVDVDSAGRDIQSGKPSINQDALGELARQISLRRLAGLIVVDLVGAPKQAKAAELVEFLRRETRRLGVAVADVLPVSRLGLLELSCPRRERPVGGFDAGDVGRMLEGLRDLKRALVSERTSQFVFRAGPALSVKLEACAFDWQAWLAGQFGYRFRFERDDELAPNAYEISS